MDAAAASRHSDGITGDRRIMAEDSQTGIPVSLAIKRVIGDPDLADVRSIIPGPQIIRQDDSPARAAGDITAVHVVLAEIDLFSADCYAGSYRGTGMDPEVIVRERDV